MVVGRRGEEGVEEGEGFFCGRGCEGGIVGPWFWCLGLEGWEKMKMTQILCMFGYEARKMVCPYPLHK